jgi:hypothetical protein
MDIEEKKALLNSSLERAAEQLGDITEKVYARYYERFPEAQQRFAELHPGGQHRLEGEMVEQVLYCLMQWFDCPGEIEIILLTTIPHHIDTLHVKPAFFSELMTTVCETIIATIPPGESGERAVWDELQETMQTLCDQGSQYARATLAQAAYS